jgi:transcriptional regulator with XRE-family HTH domain
MSSPEELTKELAGALWKYAQQQGVRSYREFAQRSGVSANTIRNWVQGKSDIRIANYIRLCRALNFPAPNVAISALSSDEEIPKGVADFLCKPMIKDLKISEIFLLICLGHSSWFAPDITQQEVAEFILELRERQQKVKK